MLYDILSRPGLILNPPPNLFSLPQAQIMDFFLKLEADFDKILRMRNKK